MKKVSGNQWKITMICLFAMIVAVPYIVAQDIGWIDELKEDFEIDFPVGKWDRVVESGDYAWGRSNHTAASGVNSIWCARKAFNGAPTRTPNGNYANNMSTYAIYGPIDMRNCTQATISFYMWHLITDNDKLKFLVDVGNGWEGYTYSGNSEGWKRMEFDLSNGPWGNALWKRDVYIAFKFSSDAAGAATGAFIDSVTIRKYFTGWPDLAFSQFGFSPQSNQKGDAFFIQGSITNPQTNPAQSTQMDVVISADNIIDTQVDLILGKVDVPALETGEVFSFTERFFAPLALPAGDYYIAGILDPQNNISEDDETNNLVIADSKITLTPYSGWDVVLDEGFEGDFPSAGWTQTPGAGNYSWDNTTFKSFEGGASLWCNGANYNGVPNVYPANGYALNSDAWALYGPFNLTDVDKADLSFAFWQKVNDGSDKMKVLVSFGQGWQGYEFNVPTDGWHYHQLDLMAWPGWGSLKGLNIHVAFNFVSNNQGNDTGTFVDKVMIRRQYEKPDLIVSEIAATPVMLAPGESFTVNSKVKNVGSAASAAETEVKVYLSTDATITDADVLIGTNTVPVLDINAEAAFTNTGAMAAGQAEGTYYVGAIVDPANAVDENAENNNTGVAPAVTVKIPVPDLTCTAIAGSPSSLSAGSTLQASATVANQGDGDAGASQVKLLLSSDQTIDAGDVEIAIVDVAALAAGASQNCTAEYVLPQGQAAGNYYVCAVVDVANSVAESNEGNNEAVAANAVTVTGGGTAVDSEIAPEDYALYQNYPNPFNPETTIRYALPNRADVRIAVTNVHGQTIRVLVNESVEAGTYDVVWNGTNQNGDKVASGVYFYSITSGSFREIRKMVLVQ
ncbi:T9SS type A sorting domain-containing protein [bacterium]|nr:T9SS type A sorting domain-containing protein [bacterium]